MTSTASNPVQWIETDGDNLIKCSRCKEVPALLISRKEGFCPGCFVFFMKGKQRKLMLNERYKVKYGPVAEKFGVQKVLLPFSFGTSSGALYDMVASLLKEQNLAHNGKQGFELVVLHILEDKTKEEATAKLEELALLYSPVKIETVILDLGEKRLNAGVLRRIRVNPQFEVFEEPADKSLTIPELLRNVASNSLRDDLLQLVYNEVILQTAISNGCHTIIPGHSMTRLANEVLALTVKGRGAEIHEAIADRTFTLMGHEVHIIFPLRDIMYAEGQALVQLNSDIQRFVNIIEEEPTSLVKDMTVQALVTQYFKNLDASGYASTASTVVKTAEKLGAPKHPVSGKCRLCGKDIHLNSADWLLKITESTPAPLNTDAERQLAQEYENAYPVKVETESRLSFCYWCTVTAAGAGDYVWPIKEEQDILNEYILEDD